MTGWGGRGGFLGVGALGLPGIDGIAVQAVFTILLLLLLTALFLFFAFLAAIAHGKKILAETSVREWCDVGDVRMGWVEGIEAEWRRAASHGVERRLRQLASYENRQQERT